MFNIKFKKLNLAFNLALFSAKRGEKRIKRFILFPDLPAGDKKIPDFFKRDPIAREISSAIRTSEGQMNFLISGEWGIGKTSILKLIEKDLKNSSIKYLWFSPWKYSGSKEESNAISRVFLTNLAENLGKPHEVRDLYIKKQVEREKNLLTQIITLLQLIICYSIYLVIIFITLSIIGPVLFKNISLLQRIVGKIGETETFAIVSALLALPPLGQYFVSKIKEQGETERISSPELFEIKFRSLLEKTIKFKSIQMLLSFWEETFSKTWLAFLGKPLTDIFHKFKPFKLDRLVIFVDDLDRCINSEVKEFLSGMKTFLEHPKVYYILAADIDKLKKNAPGKDPEVLRKIVQLDWNVPFLRKGEIEGYTKKLLKEVGAEEEFKDKELGEIFSMLRLYPNPRKIKYYIRRLLFELNLEKARTL